MAMELTSVSSSASALPLRSLNASPSTLPRAQMRLERDCRTPSQLDDSMDGQRSASVTSSVRNGSPNATYSVTSSVRNGSPNAVRLPKMQTNGAGWGHWRVEKPGSYEQMNSSPNHPRPPSPSKMFTAIDANDGPPIYHPETLDTTQMLLRPEAISMPKMSDEKVIPVGMPLGINEMEKQIWLALFAATQKLMALGECATAEEATKQVTTQWCKTKGRDSREFRFALRWCVPPPRQTAAPAAAPHPRARDRC